MTNKILTILITAVLIACSEPQNVEVENSKEIPLETKSVLAPLPADRWDFLMNNCTSLDFTFYTLGFSMSASSCSQTLPLIDRSTPAKTGGSEFGHILFLINGEKYCIAKINLSTQLNYLKFEFDDGVYYQNLNQAGISYFANIQAQVEAQRQKQP